MTHITHIEFTGTRYYWWCQHPDCEGSSRLFVYEADCAHFAAQHEQAEPSAIGEIMDRAATADRRAYESPEQLARLHEAIAAVMGARQRLAAESGHVVATDPTDDPDE